ncbi:MAG: TolC family protein [Betaproteobacteria bacterium]|nr:TolC family protein [Betaproteobacteria bacterium]
MKAPNWRVCRAYRRTLLSGLACCALSSCATYHPLPLATRADLGASITQVRHTVPAGAGRPGVSIDVSRALSVDQIGVLAILNDPALRAERGQSELARAGVIQSALLPNPSVGLGYAALLGGPGTTGALSASLSQDIASLVTYHNRVASARAHAAQVNAQLLWQEWQVAQKARLLALDLYWGGQAIAASQARLAALTQLSRRLQQAVDQGSLSLAALGPVQASLASQARALQALHLTQMDNWRALDALLGLRPAVRFDIARPHPPAAPAQLDALAASVAQRRPDLIALRLGYRSADQDVRAAILGQFPAFVLGGSWNSDTSDVRSGGPTVTFDLPIFNRNQGQIAKASATRRVLHAQYQSRLDDTQASILALRARSQYLAARLGPARAAAATASAQAAAARGAYAQHNLDQRTLDDYESTALQQRLALFDLQRGLGEARIALTLELGLGLPPARIAPLDSKR